ncbi:hypothetical protein GSI_07507 [Ganoderma sinense ZZ0214-1]|uniref:DUF6533 domain-containing protein n=1 Tax=Ganoderma sinense ZZ0214-1 TaxID=1077348 RepID=A0A2G8S980_9APHY|nr:hypothetical protein GSI_07507 [Ganoderma sinense ZZ0214-1]
MDTQDSAAEIAQISYLVSDGRVFLGSLGEYDSRKTLFLDFPMSTDLYMPVVLVLYEYLVTFSAEVQLFWRRDITGASILFFVNRYMMLSYVLISLLWYWPKYTAFVFKSGVLARTFF